MQIQKAQIEAIAAIEELRGRNESISVSFFYNNFFHIFSYKINRMKENIRFQINHHHLNQIQHHLIN